MRDEEKEVQLKWTNRLKTRLQLILLGGEGFLNTEVKTSPGPFHLLSRLTTKDTTCLSKRDRPRRSSRIRLLTQS